MLVCLGIAGAAAALVGAIAVLAIRDFGFSVDVIEVLGFAVAIAVQ